ncbi:MAG TPA: hypothetical protein VGG02_00530 [Chthoniobacterales bacterium]|jgi:hypothetical protein
MKAAKQKRDQSGVFFLASFDPVTAKALALFSEEFPLMTKRKKRLVYRQQRMAERLVMLALAHIEAIVPRFKSMIAYCEAEGMNQVDYLESLIETKFANNMHVNDDDDDGGAPVHAGARNL